MATRWENMTDDELTEEAQTGLRGQGATIEMLRRIARVAQQNTTRRLTWVVVICTVLLLLGQWTQIYLQWYGVPIEVHVNTPIESMVSPAQEPLEGKPQ